MTPNLTALSVRFDINTLAGESLYGITCWKTLWRTVDIKELAGIYLFGGDTQATLYRRERVYCIDAQGRSEALATLRRTLSESYAFKAVTATPPFLRDEDVVREPLVPAGQVHRRGKLVFKSGDYDSSRIALKDVTEERKRATPEPGEWVTLVSLPPIWLEEVREAYAFYVGRTFRIKMLTGQSPFLTMYLTWRR